MSDYAIDHRIDVYGSALERNSEGRFGDHRSLILGLRTHVEGRMINGR